MSENVLLEHCSPTLAGIKTGNLVSCSFETKEEVISDLRRWNMGLAKKGIRIIPLRFYPKKVLLYIYRPGKLGQDLQREEAEKILKSCGYKNCLENGCITTLIRHLRENSEFPHEIGLFLSYPAEDVQGFIANKGKDYKYSGPWKVYGDVEERKKQFESYRACTKAYCSACACGKTMMELAVAL